jgi:hypothetical protein
VVAASPDSVADELRRSADRFISIVGQLSSALWQSDSVCLAPLQS